MDKNECCFIGRIGSPIKVSRAQNGNPYLWFLLEIESKATAKSTENNQHQKINIMCFKKPIIDYMQKVNAHLGNLVIVFGFVASFVSEIKGKEMTLNAINANEIYIIKTQLYANERQ